MAAIAVVAVACGTSAEDRVKASAPELAAAPSFVVHYKLAR